LSDEHHVLKQRWVALAGSKFRFFFCFNFQFNASIQRLISCCFEFHCRNGTFHAAAEIAVRSQRAAANGFGGAAFAQSPEIVSTGALG
jgi:hypothetical protein